MNNAFTFLAPVRTLTPVVTYTKGKGEVTLNWDKIIGADRYAVFAYVNGKWQKAAEVGTTSYTFKGLTGGKHYNVAVIAKIGSRWYTDVTNAIRVKPGDIYPKVSSFIYGNSVSLEWDAISDAEGYAVGCKVGGKWKILKQLSASETEFSISKVPSGTYELAVIAKTDGKWDTTNLNSRTVTITVN
ncbi:hypothetical protein SAMN02910447_02115 [Ruminococcus sp. YE71]|uniref:hypothetical protein n=1 Tax=unclassified Ruminococcus TaxID=2608920 RepID=UPI00087FF9E3|nr:MULTISPECIES: hypothetical protein [unclassified Ruminococcus]SDA21890.1 hypothetical protein SAMN02910446_01984 [Ruminococcus sp. YE78]SFW37070.1 hypothetical protein SAMN02910447_02115 [Ruminococcus sp. YE71]